MIEAHPPFAVVQVVAHALALGDHEFEALTLVAERIFLFKDLVEAQRRQQRAVEFLGDVKGIGADGQMMDRVDWHGWVSCDSPNDHFLPTSAAGDDMCRAPDMWRAPEGVL